MPAKPSLKESAYSIQEETLSIRDHLDPDKHWIGEGLPAPSEEEIASTGTRTHVGDSPFPARADHAHELVLHHSTVGNTANYVYNATWPTIVYVNNLVNYGPEDWLEGSTTKVKLEYPGVYLVFCHFQIQRSTGVWAGTEAVDIRFALNDAASSRRAHYGNLPVGRSLFKVVLSDRLGIATPPPANSNIQFGLASNDTVDLWVRIANCYLIRLSSGEAPEGEEAL